MQTKAADIVQAEKSNERANFFKGRELEYFKILDSSMDVAVSILDENLIYQYISQSAYKELGFTPEEIGPGDSLSLCHELMCKKGLITQELLEERRLDPEELQAAPNTQTLASVGIVELANGRVQRLVRKPLPNGHTISMATDITDVVEKERILESSLVLGRSGYWIYDFKTKTHKVSQSVHSFTTPNVAARIQKQGIIAFIHPEDRHLFKHAIQNIHQNKGRFEFTARVLSRLNNSEVWCVFTGNAIKNKAGELYKLRTFIKDVTKTRAQSKELEIAKDEALAASQAKSQFLANMSHEIRTPMNGVLGMAELLASTDIDDRQREFVNVIMQSSTALLTIINDILDFSKIEAGALTLDPLPLNFRDIVNDVAKLLTNQELSKDLELVVNYPTGLPCGFIGDAGRLRQILMNLVGNALKFTKRGHVMIDVDIVPGTETHSLINVKVKDTGIGIDSHKVDAIFNKFTQADGSTTRVYGGTGLGLSITKHLVEMMNGEVYVESELGVGSTFAFKIPLQIDASAKMEVFDTRALEGKRVLIIDDIEVNRRILTERLAFWSMESDASADCVDAVAKLKAAQDNNTPFDLILLDFLMPGMNGLEFASHMKTQSAITMCPIIMLSSVDQSKTTVELNEMGVNLYLTKPVREKRLHETMSKIFAENISKQLAPVKAPLPVAIPAPLERTEVPKPIAQAPLAPTPIAVAETQTPLAAATVMEVGFMNRPVSLSEIQPDHHTNSVVDEALAQFGPDCLEPLAQTAPVVVAKPLKEKVVDTKDLNIQILVAEDFQLNQDVVRLMLSGSGFEPVFANNGKEAVETYKNNPGKFQAIVMDVSMPVMDGYEATKMIQRHNYEHDIPQIPIIALTGHALSHDRQLCIDAGMDDYMTKPVQQALLIERLKHHTGIGLEETSSVFA